MTRYDIYCITNEDTGRQYVGCTSQGYQKRWIEHTRAARNLKQDGELYEEMREIGADAFFIEKIDEIETNQVTAAYDLERSHMIRLGTVWPNGYNFAPKRVAGVRRAKPAGPSHYQGVTYRVPVDFPKKLRAYADKVGAHSLNKALEMMLNDVLAKARRNIAQGLPYDG